MTELVSASPDAGAGKGAGDDGADGAGGDGLAWSGR